MNQRFRLLFSTFLLLLVSSFSKGQSSIFFPPDTVNPTCLGIDNGSVNFNFTGNAGDFFFSWSGGNLPTNGNPISGDGLVSQTSLRAGDYFVFIQDNNSGFDTTIFISLKNQRTVVVNAGNDINNCLGQPVNLSATSNAISGSIFQWNYVSTSGPKTLLGQNVSIPASPSTNALTSSGPVSILVTDPSGCSASNVINVTVNIPPTGAANPITQNICSGPLSVALSSNQIGTTYTWTTVRSGVAGAVPGSGLAINQNVRATGTANGTVTYNIRPVSTVGCVGPVFTSTATILPKPAITSTPDSAGVCSGIPTAFVLGSSLTPTTFHWVATGSQVSGFSNDSGSVISQTLTATGITNGKVIYKVSGTSNGCKSDSIRVVATVKPIPVVSVDQNDTLGICTGQSIPFNYSSNTPGSSFFWTVKPNGAGAIGGTGSINSQTYSNPGNTILNADFSAIAVANACSSLAKEHRVKVFPSPVIEALTLSDSICTGDSIRIQLVSNLPNTSFSWTSAANGLTGNSNGNGDKIKDELIATGLVSGDVTYTINGTTPDCPGVQITKKIYVKPRPTISSLPIRDTLCSGNATSFAFSSNLPGTIFNWTVQPGSITGASAGSGNLIQQLLVNPVSGTDSATYTIVGSYRSCAGPEIISKAIVVRSAPPVPSDPAPVVCSGTPLQVDLSPNTNWNWRIKSGSAFGATAGSGTSFNQTLINSGNSDKTLVYSIFGSISECPTDTLFLPVLVKPLPKISAIVAEDSICSGQSVQVDLSALPSDNVAFSWSVESGNVIGASAGTGATINQNLSLISGNLGSVTYHIFAERAGCIDSVLRKIVVSNPDIPFNLNPVDSNLCDGDSVIIVLSAQAPGLTYNWTATSSNVNGASAGSGNQIRQKLSLADASAGNGFVDYTVTPISGPCAGIPRSKRIAVNNFPAVPLVAILSGSSPICPGDSMVLSSSAVSGNQWIRNAQNILAPKGISPVLTVLDSGNYEVRVTNLEGCGSTSAAVRVDRRPLPAKPIISGPLGVCAGGSVRLHSNALDGNQWQLDGVDIPGASDTFLVISQAGNYSIRLSNSICKVVSDVFAVSQFPAVPQPLISGPANFCASGTATLNSSSSLSSRWFRNGIEISGAIGQSLVVNQSGAYSVLVSDANACSASSADFSVTADPVPTPSTITGLNAICLGAEATLSASANSNYKWLLDGLEVAGANLQTLNISQFGTYSVVVNLGTCSDTSLPFKVVQTPANFTVDTNIVAAGCQAGIPANNGQISLVVQAGSGNYSYNWSNSLPNQATQSNLAPSTYSVVIKDLTSGCISNLENLVVPAPPVLVLGSNLINDSRCDIDNGSISITPAGSPGPFGFVWTGRPETSSSITGLASGTYEVLVTDINSGCVRTLSGIQIGAPDSVEVFASNKNVTCSGPGSILLTVSGGSAQYSYDWSGTGTGLVAGAANQNSISAGIYQVTVLDINTRCSRTISNISIQAFDSIVISIQKNNPSICNGINGSATAITGIASANYTWKNEAGIVVSTDSIASGLASGNYKLVVSSGICIDSAEVILTNPSIVLQTTVSQITGCGTNDGSINLQISGQSGLASFSWTKNGLPYSTSQNITGLQEGIYEVVVQASACSSSTSVTINPSSLITYSKVITAASNCTSFDGSIQIIPSGDPSGLHYSWFTIPGGLGVGGDSARLVSAKSGLYSLVLTKGACVDTSQFLISALTQSSVQDSLVLPGNCGASNGKIIIVDSAQFAGQTAAWFQNGQLISNGFSLLNVGSGSYQLLVTNNLLGGPLACDQPYEFLLPQGSGLGLSVMTDSADCNNVNGSAMVQITAGTTGLVYNWTKEGDPSFSGIGSNQNNLSAGNYKVVVMGSGCSDSLSFTIVKRNNCQPCNFPIFFFEQQPSTCFSSDGSLVACVIGAMDDATYLWTNLSTGAIIGNNDTITGIPAGNFKVTVNQGTCVASAEHALRKDPPPYSIGFGVTNATCANNDGSVTAIIGGTISPSALINISSVGGGVSVDSTFAGGLASGEYRITVTDGFCFASRSQIMVDKPKFCGPCALNVVTASNPVLCSGSTNGEAFAFIESGGFGPFTYKLNEGPAQTKSEFLASFSNQPAGPFKVVVIDQFSGCTDTVRNVIGTQLTMGVSVFTEKPGCDTLGGKIQVTVGGATAPYQVVLAGDTMFTTIRTDTIISSTGDSSFVAILDTMVTSYSDTVLSNDGVAEFSGLQSGFYQILVTSAEACTTSVRSVDLQGIRPVEFAFGKITATTCVNSNDGTFRLSRLKGSPTFTYFIAGFSQQILPIDTGLVIGGLPKGTYNLRLMGSSSCDLDTVFTIPGPDSVKVYLGQIVNSICSDSAGSLKIDSITGGAGAPWIYTLNRDGLFFASDTLSPDSVIRNLPSGLYTLSLSDSNGCQQSKEFRIEVIKQNVDLNLAVSSTGICAGESVTFTATTSLPGFEFYWYRNGSLLFSELTGVLSLNNLGNGESIQVRIFPDGNCFNQTSLVRNSGPIAVTPIGTTVDAGISAISNTTVCEGQSVTFQALNVNGIPNIQYSWLVDGLPVAGQTASTFVYSPSAAQSNVQVRLTASSGTGCLPILTDISEPILVTRLLSITIHDSIFVVSPADSDLICRNTPVTFGLKTNLKGRVPFEVDWYRDDTLLITKTDTFLTLRYLKPGDRIRAIVRFESFYTCLNTNNGVGSDKSQEITLGVRASVNDSIRRPSACGGRDGAIILRDSARFAGLKIRWYQNEVPLSRTFKLENVPAGTYQLVVSDTINNADCFCSFSLNITIPDGTGLGLYALVDSANCIDVAGAATIYDSLAIAGLNYTWTKTGDPAFSASGKSQTNLSSGNYKVVVSGSACSDTIQVFVPKANVCDTACNIPIFVYEVQPTTCFSSDGALVACAIGAMDASYTWFNTTSGNLVGNDDTLRNIPAGNYRVVVSENGCSASKDYELRKSPVPFTISALGTNPTCANNDGKIVVNLSGVSSNYSISIASLSSGIVVSDSLSADSLPSGIYRVSVTDGFCFDSRDVEIKKPIFCGPCELKAEAASNPVYCPGLNDGRAFAIVTSGGIGPFQYILNGNDTLNQTQFLQIFPSQPIGPFTVVIQDLTTQCKDTVSDFIGSIYALSAAVTTLANDCDTVGSVSVSLGGVAGPYTVILSGDTVIAGTDTIRTIYSDTLVVSGNDTTFTGIKAGAYKVSVISSQGCITSVSGILIDLRTPVELYLGEIRPVTCAGNNNGSITIDSLAGSDTYLYFIPGIMTDYQPLIAGQTISNLSVGTYLLRIKGNRSCDIDTTITITGPDPLQFLIQGTAQSACGDSAGTAKVSFITGGNGKPYTYDLLLNGIAFRSDTLAPDSVISNLPPGSYSMILYDTKLCAAAAVFTIDAIKFQYALTMTADTNKICSGDTVRFTAITTPNVPGMVYNWYVNGSFYSNSGPVQNIPNLNNADYVYVEVAPDPNCFNPGNAQSQIISIQVTPVGAELVAGIVGIDTLVCAGGLAVVQAQNPAFVPDVTYTWFVNGIEQLSQTSDILSYVPLQAVDTVQLVMTAISGTQCLSKSVDTSRTILVYTSPLSNVKDSLRRTSPANNVFLCPGTPVTYALGSSLQVPFTVEWYANDTLKSSGTDTSYTFTGLSGTVRIRAVVKFDSSLTCLATNGPAGIDSTINYVLQFLPANDPRCLPCALDLRAEVQNLSCASNADGKITATVTGGTGAYVYHLLPVFSNDTSASVFTNLLPGNYILTVRDTITQCVDTLRNVNVVSQHNYAVNLAFENSCSCVDTADGMIEVIGVEDGSGNSGKYLYSLVPGYPAFSSQTLFENLVPDTFQIRVKDTITGCITTITKIITRKDPVDGFISLLSGVNCHGGSDAKLKVDSILHGSGLYQFSLSGAPGSYVPVQAGDTLEGFAAGLTFVYIRDLKTGCVDSNQILVPEPAQLVFGLQLTDTSSCISNTGKVKISGLAGGTSPYSFQYQLPDSSGFDNFSLPSDSIINNLGGGLLIVRITDSKGCFILDSIQVPVDRPVIGNINLISPCIGDTNGIIRLSGISGGQAPYLFTLTNGFGEVVATQSDTVFSGLSTGLYSISIKDASGAAGCENVYIRALLPTQPLRFNLVRFKESTCNNFDGEAVFALSGGQRPYRFSFDSLAAQFTNYALVVGLNDTLKITGLSARAPGEFYSLKIRDNGPDGGCNYDTSFVQPGQAPLQYAFSSKNIICYGEASGSVTLSEIRGTGPIVLTVKRIGSDEIVVQDTLKGSYFQNSTFELGGIPAGDFNLEVLQFGVCSGSKSIPFSLSQPPEIIIHARMFRKSAQGFRLGGVLLDSITGGFKPYLVSFNGGAQFSYHGDSLFRKLNPGAYSIRVQDDTGCVVTNEIECEEDEEIFVPTLFTPNGDDLNDKLEIRNLPAGSRFVVKDRWGKEVFASGDYKNDWDGKDLEIGNYFWRLDMPGLEGKSGWVMIER